MSSNEPIEQPPVPPSLGQPSPLRDPNLPPSPPTRQRTIAWLIVALVVIVIVVGSSPFWALGIAPLLPWGQHQQATDNSATSAISALQSRLDADEAVLKQQAARLMRFDETETALKDQAGRLSALETRPIPSPPVPAPPAQSTESASAIKALQDQLAKLATSNAATGDRVANVEKEIARADAGGRADRALLMALGNLRIAAEGSSPFSAELGTAETIAGDKPEAKQALSSLSDAAKSGLPSLAVLTERFDHRVAPAILRARGDTTNQDWWRQIKARLEHLVVVRRITPGSTEPTDVTEAAVARADASLRAGDLAEAVAALGGLNGTRQTAAATWLADARKRLAVEATLTRLWQTESARIAAAGTRKNEGAKP